MSPSQAYHLLGLTPPASAAEVRRAFRRVALRWHPDRFRTFTQQAWATRQFQKAVAARDTVLAAQGTGQAAAAEKPRRQPPVEAASATVYGLEAAAYRVTRLRHWLLEQAFADAAMLALVAVFGLFRLGVWLSACGLGAVGLRATHDAPTRLGRLLYLLVCSVVAGAHVAALCWIGVRWSGGRDSDAGLLWAFGYGSPIWLFILAECLGFLAWWRGQPRLARELVALALEGDREARERERQARLSASAPARPVGPA